MVAADWLRRNCSMMAGRSNNESLRLSLGLHEYILEFISVSLLHLLRSSTWTRFGLAEASGSVEGQLQSTNTLISITLALLE